MEPGGIMLVEYNGRSWVHPSALFPLKENSDPGLLPSDSMLLNLAVSEGQDIGFRL